MPFRRVLMRLALQTIVVVSMLAASEQGLTQAPPPKAGVNEEQLLQAVQEAQRSHGAQSMERAKSLRELADFYYSEQRLPDTERALEQAVAITEQIEPTGMEMSWLLQELGQVHFSNERLDLAMPLYQRALQMREALLGPQHVDLAVLLLNVGDTHRMNAEYAAALPPMRRALALRENGLPPNHPDIAWATSFIGSVHRDVSDYATALQYFERTLAIRESALEPTHRYVSRSLTDLALLHRDMGNYEAALPLLQRALQIDRIGLGPNHPDLVNALSSLGLVLRDMGEYAQALPLFDQALQIDLAAFGENHPYVGARLTQLGLVYRALNDLPRAMLLYERALAIEQNQPQPRRTKLGERLHNLGLVKSLSGNKTEALDLFQRALKIEEEVYGAEHRLVAPTLASLALVYRDRGELDLATVHIERAIEIERKSGGALHPRLAIALFNAGLIRQAAGDTDRAAQAFHAALPIAARGDQAATLWRVQNVLATLADARGDAELAVYWRKQSVNTVQAMRGKLYRLSPDVQRAFLTDKRAVYIALADQLIAAGRLAEAQEVLSMLKEEELYDYVARSSGEDSRSMRASFTGPAETEAHERWNEISSQLAQLGRESGELTRKARLGLAPEEQLRRRQVEADLVLANQRFDAFLAALSREFADAGARRAEALGARQLRNLVVMQDVLAELGRDTVLLHYVVAESRVAIIVTTADVQIARESRISAADLNRKVLAFRQALAARSDVTASAQELYRLLIAPVAADLKQAGARTLMLSLDGTLRYLPFAALHDGRRYLIESYTLSIYTEAARTQITRKPQPEWTMTGLGVTRAAPGFAPLPAVRQELEGIRRNGLRGDVYLDEQFTAERLRDALGGTRQVMHIASHFQFKPGTFANSFLVLGDGGRLTLQEIRDRRLRFSNIELLTLSACDTAMGGGIDETGAEVEGFGALAQQQGASAVLATLWPVADGSTGRFMQLVYGRRHNNPKLTKAEALRQAQLTFLRSTQSAVPAAVRSGLTRPAAVGTDPPFTTDPTRPHAHPYYWAAFILMGNWL